MKCRIKNDLSAISEKEYLNEVIKCIRDRKIAPHLNGELAVFAGLGNQYPVLNFLWDKVEEPYRSAMLDAFNTTVMLAPILDGHTMEEIQKLVEVVEDHIAYLIEKEDCQTVSKTAHAIVVNHLFNSSLFALAIAAYNGVKIGNAEDDLDVVSVICELFYKFTVAGLYHTTFDDNIYLMIVGILARVKVPNDARYCYKLALKAAIPDKTALMRGTLGIPAKSPVHTAVHEVPLLVQDGDPLYYEKRDFLRFFTPDFDKFKTRALDDYYRSTARSYVKWMTAFTQVASSYDVALYTYQTYKETVPLSDYKTLSTEHSILQKDHNKLLSANSKISKQLEEAQTKIQAPTIITTEKVITTQDTVELNHLRSKCAKLTQRLETQAAELAEVESLRSKIAELESELAEVRDFLNSSRDDVEEVVETISSDDFTQEELNTLYSMRAHIMVPDFPSLRKLYEYLPNSEIVFMHKRFTASFEVGSGKDVYLLCTGMCSHGVFERWENAVKHKNHGLVHKPGFKTICRRLLELQKG